MCYDLFAMNKQHATFRFYEELNDFLPSEKQKQEILYTFRGQPAIKDPIEAIGVPHTEVDLILVNGISVGFSYQLQSNDRVSVYPEFESLDISSVQKLRDTPLRRTAFVLDVHLGTLARLLRFLGFDVIYRNDFDDPEIIRIGLDEHRIILTRDRRMLFHRCITHARCMHSTDTLEQVREVLDRFDLYDQIRMSHRCPRCNGLVQAVDKNDILDQLEPLTIKYYSDFSQCTDCGQIYWKGGHYKRLIEQLGPLLGEEA